MAARGLHEFEVSAIGNLAPSNAEEAKALVPSLDPAVHAERKGAHLSDSEVEEMLKDVATFRES